eukprot:m.330476 g.330476  ORF g.330476 m.330476 type:complete len:399 (-) comp55609_c0_seq7:854-2050(-)
MNHCALCLDRRQRSSFSSEMHGRAKVRTNEEQAELKKKQRAEKLAQFQAARAALFAKRAKGHTDTQAFEMITMMLTHNPDFSTLWNYRREIFLHVFASLSGQDLQQRCVDELAFLDACLMHNPKSYSVWQQRRWIMAQASSPPWTSELALCTKFLKFDDRNFHCWDYRRHVVSQLVEAGDTTIHEAEFAFTYGKITESMSNYSAWHYRSSLLPIVRPAEASDMEAYSGVATEVMSEEFVLAANAFYIDPTDQSAWIYHRWLLGRQEKQPKVCAITLNATPSPDELELLLVFSQPVVVQSGQIVTTVNGVRVDALYHGETGSRSRAASLWISAKLIFFPLFLNSSSLLSFPFLLCSLTELTVQDAHPPRALRSSLRSNFSKVLWSPVAALRVCLLPANL